MKSWIALVKRELLEHRGAFVYFPLGVLALFALAVLSAHGLGRLHVPFETGMPSTAKLYEIGCYLAAAFWWAYLLLALFFYFADAFSADRRNNAMLFWKSMPVSDLKVLASKLLAGATIFPAIIFALFLATGLVLFFVAQLMALFSPLVPQPSLLAYGNALLQVSAFVLVHTVLGLLWYAPFFAWVGILSIVVGRWSMALAIVIPLVIGILENILTYGTGPQGGFFLNFLGERLTFGLRQEDVVAMFSSVDVLSAEAMSQRSVPAHRLDQPRRWARLHVGCALRGKRISPPQRRVVRRAMRLGAFMPLRRRPWATAHSTGMSNTAFAPVEPRPMARPPAANYIRRNPNPRRQS